MESNFSQKMSGPVDRQAFASQTPGTEMLQYNDMESHLITSDSDFEEAEKEAGYEIGLPQQKQTCFQEASNLTLPKNLKKDVTRTFKKMLTSNHNRSTASLHQHDEISTRYGGSQPRQEFDNGDNLTQLSEIETKFKKKKESAMRKLKTKIFKEDAEGEQETFADNFMAKAEGANNMTKTKKEDIRQLEEFISTKRPKDPFKDLDPLSSKVDITPSVRYQGTSQNDVLQ